MRWPLFFPLPKRGACLDLLVICSLVALLWHFIGAQQFNHAWTKKASSGSSEASNDARRSCQRLPGAHETVVVIETSAAELEERLPIHFSTTIPCYPNYLIFSDWAAKYKNHTIRDALSSVSPALRSTHPDFDLWRRLRKGGPDVLEDEEIWNSAMTTKDLDKWMILPIIRQTFERYPNQKWYVFLETDTFVHWSNLLAWLQELDPKDLHYIRASEDQSSQSGSGVTLSHASMELLAKEIDAEHSTFETLTKAKSSGGAVLRMVLAGIGVKPTFASPKRDTASLGSLDYNERTSGKRRWCSPAVAYHGVSPANIAELWKFEQECDMFQFFIKPRLAIRFGRVDDWDNYSSVNPAHSHPASSVDQCLQSCAGRSECVQFFFFNGTCHLSYVPRLGDFAAGVRSRWILPRLVRWVDNIEACRDQELGFI
ncbi:hypothetical protein CLAFUW4_02430 [Fulvia fulva]|nr:hypothetical protein CLAFUR4_02425 [Fulvia fulva]KAK4634010.1 hypothetical protein CLAFUR0_02429 [Fulvia fulva]WPV10757.1 hypothetical protein CLAFUW4_02430 [Fulvia fulva]WPV25684.1 hypothetical protein CLAFUW7_02430 [Fulvia fulva]